MEMAREAVKQFEDIPALNHKLSQAYEARGRTAI